MDTPLADRLRRAEAALTNYDADTETDTSPATLISSLLDFITVTNDVPAALTAAVPAALAQAVLDHATHTTEAATGTASDHAVEQAYATIAGAIIGSLLDEARHMDHLTAMDILAIALRTYQDYATDPE